MPQQAKPGQHMMQIFKISFCLQLLPFSLHTEYTFGADLIIHSLCKHVRTPRNVLGNT